MKKNREKILLLYPATNENYGLYNDLRHDSRVYIRCTSYRHDFNCRFLSFIRKAYLSERVNRIINLPLKEKWYNFYDIYSLALNTKYILVIDLSLNNKNLLDILYRCREKNPEISIGLFFINSWGTMSSSFRSELNAPIKAVKEFPWDDIFTFDPEDAKKFNMSYLGFNYYSKHPFVKVQNPSNDIYSIAFASKDRYDLYVKLYSHLTNNGCICNFNLRVYDNVSKYIKGINYLDKVLKPYDAIISDIQNSKCILEILRDKQRGPSLRYFEAVCYNKKLLTNNPAIVSFPYYNEKYMRVFDKPEDIDLNWLKEDITNVEYHYKGDFSPTKLIDFLLEKH